MQRKRDNHHREPSQGYIPTLDFHPESTLHDRHNMAVRQRADTLTRLQATHASFCKRLTMTEIHYLDIGLEYHALPLQLRRATGVAQADCTTAFIISDSAPIPECIGSLDDLRELCTATAHHLEHYDLDAAEISLRTGLELLEALSDQLVAVQTCVDLLHRQFSDDMDNKVEFAEGSEYRLALRPEHGLEKHELLRCWVVALPEVREWFRNGAVRSEYEALLLTVSAGGQAGLPVGGGEVSLGVSEDEVKPADLAKRRKRAVKDEGMRGA